MSDDVDLEDFGVRVVLLITFYTHCVFIQAAQPRICARPGGVSGESSEPWGAFPKPHPKDPVRWATL